MTSNTSDVLLTTINQKLYNYVELQTRRQCTNVVFQSSAVKGSFDRATLNCT